MVVVHVFFFFFFQAEDGIRDLVRSRGLGDVYKRQDVETSIKALAEMMIKVSGAGSTIKFVPKESIYGLSLIHI